VFLGEPGDWDVFHTIGKNLMKTAAKMRFFADDSKEGL
jgi:hypothetical protein